MKHLDSCLSSKARAENVFPKLIVRNGFTLLETIIVLALCGVLIAAMSGATHMYWKYRLITQEQVHSAHLLRGIVEDLTLDLRGTLSLPRSTSQSFVQSEPTRNLVTTSAHGPGIESFGREIMLNLLPDPMGTPVHLVGTRRTLAILSESANYRFSTMDADVGLGHRQHVIWWVSDGTSLRLPLILKGDNPQYTTLSASGFPHGLVRATSAISTPEHQASSDSTAPRLVSDRVSAITFQYFDGELWHSEWNSDVRNGIPSLVEITVTLSDDPDQPETFAVSIPQGQFW